VPPFSAGPRLCLRGQMNAPRSVIAALYRRSQGGTSSTCTRAADSNPLKPYVCRNIRLRRAPVPRGLYRSEQRRPFFRLNRRIGYQGERVVRRSASRTADSWPIVPRRADAPVRSCTTACGRQRLCKAAQTTAATPVRMIEKTPEVGSRHARCLDCPTPALDRPAPVARATERI
jgi:hypothetical protein